MTIKKWLLLTLSLLLSFFFTPGYILKQPGDGIFFGWEIGQAMALEKGWMLGRDFISPFGPLSFISSRAYPGASPFLFFFFDAILVALVTFVLYRIFSKERPGVVFQIIFLLLFIFKHDVAMLLLWLSVFLIFDFLDSNDQGPIMVLTPVVAMCLLVEFRIGIVSLVLLAVFVAYGYWQKRVRSWLAATLLLSYFILISVAAFYFHLDLWSFTYLGLTDLYPDRPSTTDEASIIMAAACFLSVILPCWFFRKQIVGHKQTMLLYIMVFVFLGTLFKRAFIASREFEFFNFVSQAVLLLAMFTGVERKKIFYYTSFPVMLLAVTFMAMNSHSSLALAQRSQAHAEFIDSYLFKKFRGLPPHEQIEINDVSPELMQIIGNGSVDVIPGGLSPLTYERLNYMPRPASPSAFAHSPSVERASAEFIRSRGPEFILLATASEDARYPTHDEPLVKIELLKNYTALNADSLHVLLKRNERPLKSRFEFMTEEVAHLNDTIPLEITSALQLAYPKIEYSLLGKLFSMFLWSPELVVSLTLVDGSSHSFRFTKSLGEFGLVINKYVPPGSIDELMLFVNHAGKLNSNVSAITFGTDHLWAFKSEFTVSFRRLELEDPQRKIDPIYQPVTVKKISASPRYDLKITNNFERLIIDKSRIDCYGWAFVNDSAYRSARPKVVLVSKNEYVIFEQTKNFYRPDVRQVFGDNVSDSSGISAVVMIPLLKKDVYNVGLAIMDGKNLLGIKLIENVSVDTREEEAKLVSPATAPTLLPNEQLEKLQADTGDSLQFNIENIHATDKMLSISGWAFWQQHTKDNVSVNVLITSEEGQSWRATTLRTRRSDVAQYFKIPASDSAGFMVTVLTHDLARGVYKISIAATDDTGTRRIYRRAGYVNIGYPDVIRPEKTDGPLPSGEPSFMIDKLQDNARSFRIAGWAFIPGREFRRCQTSVLLKAENDSIFIAPTRTVRRPDVTAYFKNQLDLDNSGFEAEISKANLRRGRYRVGIYVRCGGEEGISNFSDEFIEK